MMLAINSPDEVVSMGPAQDAARLVAADARTTVLILGETGVGKGRLARQIHEWSPRASKPFVEINCAGLSAELVESELFGHERGAFTGAVSRKTGLVESAEGGTLFLDEIGELPLEVQAELLSFLDDRAYRPVGGVEFRSADVRVIAATNRDLRTEVSQGRFRSDLYYRLNVFPIQVPPLRERRQEILALARLILDDLCRTQGRADPPRVTVEAQAKLQKHSWPGNIRELRNSLERALILARGQAISAEHLPADAGLAPHPHPTQGAGRQLSEVEREHVRRVLEEVGGNITRAARILGISRPTLRRKLQGNG